MKILMKEVEKISKGVHGGHLYKEEEMYLLDLQESIVTNLSI